MDHRLRQNDTEPNLAIPMPERLKLKAFVYQYVAGFTPGWWTLRPNAFPAGAAVSAGRFTAR
jgi:hypothetical protein